MTYLVIIFGILFFTFCIRGCKDALSRLVLLIFGSFWIFSLIGSQFQIQGLYLPQDSTILICLLGVLFFTIGFLSVNITTGNIAYYNPRVLNASINGLLNNKIFKLSLVISTLFILSQDIMMYNVIIMKAAMSASELR